MITLHAFRNVPPFAQGLVRDLRARWALEEAGLTYETSLLEPGEQKSDAYRRLQPFGQVPVYEEDGLCLFESGAIVTHIAERSERLMPRDPARRAHVIQWMFAALNTVEPQVQALVTIDLFNADKAWARERRPEAIAYVQDRLAVLEKRLDGREFLEDDFTAADILTVTVLRFLRHTDLVGQYPAVDAYVRRCEARPAFQKALEAQMAPFREEAEAA